MKTEQEFWKRKLAAYLHDPPSKCLDIRTHGERSDAAFRQAGFTDEEVGEYFEHADHTGAAADRLPFPNSRAAGIECAFDGVRNAFRHPLDGTELPFHAEFKSVEEGFEGEQSIQPKISDETLSRLESDLLRWRARLFAHWRLWPKHAAEKDYRLALLPADTRIPDHSIWTHMQVVSALAGCVAADKSWRPAFLKFQLGPVQDFIAAARSTRDLWSGSYLLSWLMAAGLKSLSEKVGPDSVIFPNLRGQPLFDLHWRKELWGNLAIGDRSIWDSLKWDNPALLTPNLPNVFLALVPADRAGELGKRIEDSIERELEAIAQAVWEYCAKAGLTRKERGINEAERKIRFFNQVRRFLSPSWQSTEWPQTLEQALQSAAFFSAEMPAQVARSRVLAVVDVATRRMPQEHRDGRFYLDREKTRLNNIGLGWSVLAAANGWQLDAVRQTRNFAATGHGGWQIGTFQSKDALTGREEAVAGGEQWATACKDLGEPWIRLFKKPEWLGAMTLIKRVWHLAYLGPQWGFKARDFKMPNTRGLAAHDPFASKEPEENDEDLAASTEDLPPSEKYFAVLALDGDEIGKWISGHKTPPFRSQLADYKDGSGNRGFGSRPYFERHAPELLEGQRPLSPSYHLQFSEGLSNFSLLCARAIVEAFDGRLIYAGGDDVLALLPADTALACAQALRCAFKGQSVTSPSGSVRLFQSRAPGFLSTDNWKDDHQRGHPIPFLVPGERTDCSVGIAIAHFKSPLQDVVRAAQAAERRAKNDLGRSAVAVTLVKRSGEIIEWGCKWGGGGLDLYQAIASQLETERISSKFPHRAVELLEPYRNGSSGLIQLRDAEGFEPMEIIQREFDHTITRQSAAGQAQVVRADLEPKLKRYLSAMAADLEEGTVQRTQGNSSKCQRLLSSIVGLCQTVAFAHRTRT
jgi:hypothetical protein